MRPVERVLEKLEVTAGPEGKDEYLAFCPAHDDRNTPNLRLREAEDGNVLLHCFAGCSQDEVLAALEERGVPGRDLFPHAKQGHAGEGGGRGVSLPPKSRATMQPHPANGIDERETGLHASAQRSATPLQRACTLEAYAEAKKLPVEFLRELGLMTVGYMGKKAVRMPYLTEDGQEGAVRMRVALDKTERGDNRFRWRKGSRPALYGLWRMNRIRGAGYVVLVEGESDCHTLWHHSIEALGVPGANSWKEEWAGHLDGIEKVYAVVEPDEGGEALKKKLTASMAVRDRLHLVELAGSEDVSAHYLADPERFKENLRAAFGRATLWADELQAKEESRIRQAREACDGLARKERILETFAERLRRSGVAGESRVVKLLYLALTSRLLERPVSVAVKGPSSGGKSYLTESVLRFFPREAYHALTAMSEPTLAYSEEPIKHRFLVFFEAEGMASDFATYLVRSLLSEGRVRYETVESTKDGIRPRLIEREGPTGLIVTTTAVWLHPENETRLLSLTVADTQEQTRDVLAAIAREVAEGADVGPWHALQEWLSSPVAERRATIPYAVVLAELVPPVAVRLRRDFGAVLSLIRAHAILHQATRQRDEEGRVIAAFADYEVVRELVEDLVSEGIDATVSKTVRETVSAVAKLCEDAEGDPVSLAAVAGELALDKSAASRRVRRATEQGYLKNLEDRRGKPARLVLGDPVPDDLRILPATEDLEALHRCTTEALQACNGQDTPEGPQSPSTPQHHANGGENRKTKPNHPQNAGDRCTVARQNGGRDTPLPPFEESKEGGGVSTSL